MPKRMRNTLKKYVLCHLTYGLADPVDLRWGQSRYVTLKDLKRQKELGALVSSIESTCGGRMWTLRLDTIATGWNARLKEKDEVTEIRCRAEAGDGLAQLNLAACYHMGLFGIVQDAAKAFKWFKRAADNNQACKHYVGWGCNGQWRQKEPDSRVDVLRKGRGIGRVSLLFRIGRPL